MVKGDEKGVASLNIKGLTLMNVPFEGRLLEWNV